MQSRSDRARLLSKAKSKIVIPENEKRNISSFKKNKNAKRDKKSKMRNRLQKGQTRGGNKGKRRKGRKGKGRPKAQKADDDDDMPQPRELGGRAEMKEEEVIDPYVKLKATDPTILMKLLLNKLQNHQSTYACLGHFGDQLQSSMVNFISDLVVPILPDGSNKEKLESVINDDKLLYLLRQSFMRWLKIHAGQMKLIFKRKGESENALKYKYVLTKNHMVQLLSQSKDDELKEILSKVDMKTQKKYYHFLKSEMKKPLIAQLTAPIPSSILFKKSKHDSIDITNDTNDDANNTEHKEDAMNAELKTDAVGIEHVDDDDKEFDNIAVQHSMHSHLMKYRENVLLSEKQSIVDILKIQYKILQNAIEDNGSKRWMDCPIDAGHVGLIQREAIRDHSEILRKCAAMENEYKQLLGKNELEVYRMSKELQKRKMVYQAIQNKNMMFLKEKLSQIHEEIERKKEAIHLHEKKRENYLNHAQESLKNERNMRKGVKLVNDTYHKYLRNLTTAKLQFATVDDKLTQEHNYYDLIQKLNELRNKNDELWYNYKKEKEIYTRSLSSFSKFHTFFGAIDAYLVREYGDESEELLSFRKTYYKYNLNNVNTDRPWVRELYKKKKITEIEHLYGQALDDIELPDSNHSVVNRLWKNLKPKEKVMQMHQIEDMFDEAERKLQEDIRDDSETPMAQQQPTPTPSASATPLQEENQSFDNGDDRDNDGGYDERKRVLPDTVPPPPPPPVHVHEQAVASPSVQRRAPPKKDKINDEKVDAFDQERSYSFKGSPKKKPVTTPVIPDSERMKKAFDSIQEFSAQGIDLGYGLAQSRHKQRETLTGQQRFISTEELQAEQELIEQEKMMDQQRLQRESFVKNSVANDAIARMREIGREVGSKNDSNLLGVDEEKQRNSARYSARIETTVFDGMSNKQKSLHGLPDLNEDPTQMDDDLDEFVEVSDDDSYDGNDGDGGDNDDNDDNEMSYHEKMQSQQSLTLFKGGQDSFSRQIQNNVDTPTNVGGMDTPTNFGMDTPTDLGMETPMQQKFFPDNADDMGTSMTGMGGMGNSMTGMGNSMTGIGQNDDDGTRNTYTPSFSAFNNNNDKQTPASGRGYTPTFSHMATGSLMTPMTPYDAQMMGMNRIGGNNSNNVGGMDFINDVNTPIDDGGDDDESDNDYDGAFGGGGDGDVGGFETPKINPQMPTNASNASNSMFGGGGHDDTYGVDDYADSDDTQEDDDYEDDDDDAYVSE